MATRRKKTWVDKKHKTLDLLGKANSNLSHDVFSAHGAISLSFPLPSITIEGVGSIGWPVNEATIEKLKSHGEVAPNVNGPETLAGTNVRDVIQIDSSKITYCNKFRNNLGSITRSVCESLQIDSTGVNAKLHKLVLYSEGGHLDSHTDTEREPRMFGTLIVELLCDYKGGHLEIQHNGKRKLYLGDAQNNSKIRYAATYSSCTRRVRPVTQGTRVVILFNLVKTTGEIPKLAQSELLNQYLQQSSKCWPRGFLALRVQGDDKGFSHRVSSIADDPKIILAFRNAVDEHGEPLFDVVRGNAVKSRKKEFCLEDLGSDSESETSYSCVLKETLFPPNLNLTISIRDFTPRSFYRDRPYGFFPDDICHVALFEDDDMYSDAIGEPDLSLEPDYDAPIPIVEYLYKTELIAVYPRRDRFFHQKQFRTEFIDELQQSNPSTVQSILRRHLKYTKNIEHVKGLFGPYCNLDFAGSISIANKFVEDASMSKHLGETFNEEQLLKLSTNKDFYRRISSFISSSVLGTGDLATCALKLIAMIPSQVLARVWNNIAQQNVIPLQVALGLLNRNSLLQHEKQFELLEKLWPIVMSNITKLSASQLSALFDCSQKYDQCKTKCDELLKQYNLMQLDTHRVAIACLNDATDNRELSLKAASDLLDRKEDWTSLGKTAQGRQFEGQAVWYTSDWLRQKNAGGCNLVATILNLNDDELTIKFILQMFHDTSPIGYHLLGFVNEDILSNTVLAKLLLGMSKNDVANIPEYTRERLAVFVPMVNDPNVLTHLVDVLPCISPTSTLWSVIAKRVQQLGNEMVVSNFLRKMLFTSGKAVQQNIPTTSSPRQSHNRIPDTPFCYVEYVVDRFSKVQVGKCIEEMTDEELCSTNVSKGSRDWIMKHLPPNSGKVWEKFLKSISLKELTKHNRLNITSILLDTQSGQEMVLKYLCTASVPTLGEAILCNGEVICLFKSLISSKIDLKDDNVLAMVEKCIQEFESIKTPTFDHSTMEHYLPGFKVFIKDPNTQKKVFRFPKAESRKLRKTVEQIKRQSGVSHVEVSEPGEHCDIHVHKSYSTRYKLYLEVMKLWNKKKAVVDVNRNKRISQQAIDLSCGEPAAKQTRTDSLA